MPLGKVFGKIFTKGGGEGAQKGAKGVVTEGATKTVTEGATEVATDTVAKTVAETTQSSVAKAISFTTNEVAVPILGKIAMPGAVVLVGYKAIDKLGEFGSEMAETVAGLLCDSEDDSEKCEDAVASAVGLGTIILVGGVVVLGLLVTRR